MSKRSRGHGARTMSERLQTHVFQSNHSDASPSHMPLARRDGSTSQSSVPATRSVEPIAASGTRSSSSSGKSGRGYAKAIPEWNHPDDRVKVDFNDMGYPIGKMGTRLKGQLGVLIRNAQRFPLTYLDWAAVPQNDKDLVWEQVKDKLEFCPESFRPICMDICKKLWRDNKNKTKSKYFIPHRHEPDIYSRGPNHIPKEQWRELVDYWKSPEGQSISARNSQNRQHRGPPPRTGRTHFSEIRAQMDKNADKMSVFLKTRRNNDPEVIAIRAQYDELLDLIPKDQQTREVCDEIFHQVVGKDTHGYCRTYGGGIPRNMVYQREGGPSHSADPSTIDAITRRVEESLRSQLEQSLTQQITARIQAGVMEEMAFLKNRVALLESQNTPATGDASIHAPDAFSGQQALRESVGDGSTPAAMGEARPPQSPRPSDQDGIKVSLLNVGVPKQEIAEGLLLSMDPLAEIDGEPLGPDFCKVYVENAQKPDALLEWPRQGIRTIGESICHHVAWRSSDVLQKD